MVLTLAIIGLRPAPPEHPSTQSALWGQTRPPTSAASPRLALPPSAHPLECGDSSPQPGGLMELSRGQRPRKVRAKWTPPRRGGGTGLDNALKLLSSTPPGCPTVGAKLRGRCPRLSSAGPPGRTRGARHANAATVGRGRGMRLLMRRDCARESRESTRMEDRRWSFGVGFHSRAFA